MEITDEFMQKIEEWIADAKEYDVFIDMHPDTVSAFVEEVKASRRRISELEAENAKLRTDLSEIEDVAIDQQDGWQSVAVPYLPKDMWAYRKIENLAKIALGNDGSK